MAKYYLIAIVYFLLGLKTNGQSTRGLLQNFNDPKLFDLNDHACYNLSGEFAGEETEFYDGQGNIKGKYKVKFVLNQQGNKVWGNSIISFGDEGNYGNIKIRGIVAGDKFYFEEYEVVEQKFTQPDVLWCLRTGELSIKLSENQITLEGYNYKGYAAFYYFDCVGLVSMNLSKPLESLRQNPVTNNRINKKEYNIRLQPNPANNEVTVVFELIQELQVRIDLFTLSGELITNITNDFYKVGTNYKSFELGNYAAGVYLVRMSAGNQTGSKLLVISR